MDAVVVGKVHVSLGVWFSNSLLGCTGFLCTLVIANGAFSFICFHSID
jgi:hypothetical protein